MANTNTVTISGMFGSGKTYFADSPVIIDISGLQWPASSPFNIVTVDVIHENKVAGSFRGDTARQSEISFDISSALRTICRELQYTDEIEQAQAARTSNVAQQASREMQEYSLCVYTEYLASDDGGRFTRTGYGPFDGGQCLAGGLTELERSTIGNKENADVSHWEHTGVRNGDASTKPISSPERVGRGSITSWVDVKEGYTKSIFYPPTAIPSGDDVPGSQQGWTGHAPIVLRDSVDYVDFLFVNRRGTVETCSARMLETMGIEVQTKHYTLVERPSFSPSRSMTSITSGGRRSWAMSSGHQTREWAEWWTMEFLKARRVWMLYKGPGMQAAQYMPVIVEPAKKDTTIFDRAKQQMPSVEFTVTLALEG